MMDEFNNLEGGSSFCAQQSFTTTLYIHKKLNKKKHNAVWEELGERGKIETVLAILNSLFRSIIIASIPHLFPCALFPCFILSILPTSIIINSRPNTITA